MFDIGWDEMAVVAVLALVLIGPKELPSVLREAGRWVRKGRALVADFQRGVDDMLREDEMAQLRAEIERLSSPESLKNRVENAVDADGEIARGLASPSDSPSSPSRPSVPETPQRPPEP